MSAQLSDYPTCLADPNLDRKAVYAEDTLRSYLAIECETVVNQSAAPAHERGRNPRPTPERRSAALDAETSEQAWLHTAGRVELLTHAQEIALAQRMENARARCNEREEQRARDQLVSANLRLVASIARRYARRGLALEDLMQEGSIGLMLAAQKFDWRKGYRFSTYAVWWIRRTITRALTDQGGLIRLPAHVMETLSRLNKTRTQLNQRLGRPPTHIELAEAMGMSETELSALLRRAAEPLSLEMPIGEDGENRLGDILEASDTDDPMQEATRGALREAVLGAIANLTPREKDVLRLRYGLDGGEAHTLEETSRQLEVTRERVLRTEMLAFKKLRGREGLQHLLS